MADYAIAIQVLVEAGLQRFQCGAGSRHDADGVRDAVAAAVGIPHRVLIGARVLPGHFVAACRLLRAVRSPRPPELAGYHGDPNSTRLNSSHTVVSYAVICLIH